MCLEDHKRKSRTYTESMSPYSSGLAREGTISDEESLALSPDSKPSLKYTSQNSLT